MAMVGRNKAGEELGEKSRRVGNGGEEQKKKNSKENKAGEP